MAYVRLIKAFSFPGQRLDAQGRVLLPMGLRQKAGMDKAIRFVGVGRYLEIWDEARFAATCEMAEKRHRTAAFLRQRPLLRPRSGLNRKKGE